MNPKKALLSALLPALLLFALAQAAPAATEGGTKFSIFGSYYQTEDYDEARGAGFRVSFGGNIAFELTATYYEELEGVLDFDLGDNVVIRDIELDLDVIPIDAGVRFKLGEGPIYVGVGGTYFLLDGDGGLDDEYGFYGRFGVQFSNLFFEAGYREVEGTLDDFAIGESLDVFREDAFDVGIAGYFFNAGWRF